MSPVQPYDFVPRVLKSKPGDPWPIQRSIQIRDKAGRLYGYVLQAQATPNDFLAFPFPHLRDPRFYPEIYHTLQRATQVILQYGEAQSLDLYPPSRPHSA